ncbi:MAG: hypothetical protein HYZ48_02670, partial [Chlamydiales bacterium]|nr:hypothetical protein [Chlamydiales bacterium]
MEASKKAVCGLIYGPQMHYVDHLAVLCDILKVPLLVTEEEIVQVVQTYYPNLDCRLYDYFSIGNEVVSFYEIVFQSVPRSFFDEAFFFSQKMAQKKVHTIWIPHGNSDKGNSISYMEGLNQEEAALLYGKQMCEYLQRKGSFDQLKGYVLTGNFRHTYYLENRPFYDSLVEREVLAKLPPSEKVVLYAPTWIDYERSSSFFDATVPLIENLPPQWNLIIKLHPNLKMQKLWEVGEMIEKYRDVPRVLFLDGFPP